jgi:hypothetical protein
MLAQLGVWKIVRIALAAMVLLAIWRQFDGDAGAIFEAGFGIIEKGAAIITDIYTSIVS